MEKVSTSSGEIQTLRKIEQEMERCEQTGKSLEGYYFKKLEEEKEPLTCENLPGRPWALIWGNIHKTFLTMEVRSYLFLVVQQR